MQIKKGIRHVGDMARWRPMMVGAESISMLRDEIVLGLLLELPSLIPRYVSVDTVAEGCSGPRHVKRSGVRCYNAACFAIRRPNSFNLCGMLSVTLSSSRDLS